MVEDAVNVKVVKINDGEREILYVDGEYKFLTKEEVPLDALSGVKDPIENIEIEWRYGTFSRDETPISYEELCEITEEDEEFEGHDNE